MIVMLKFDLVDMFVWEMTLQDLCKVTWEVVLNFEIWCFSKEMSDPIWGYLAQFYIYA